MARCTDGTISSGNANDGRRHKNSAERKTKMRRQTGANNARVGVLRESTEVQSLGHSGLLAACCMQEEDVREGDNAGLGCSRERTTQWIDAAAARGRKSMWMFRVWVGAGVCDARVKEIG